MLNPRALLGLSILPILVASVAACSDAPSSDGTPIQRRSSASKDVDPTEDDTPLPSRSSTPVETTPPAATTAPPAPSAPSSTPAPPATNTCAMPTCFGLGGFCVCQAKDSKGASVILGCTGGVCQCIGGSNAHFDGDCASTTDAQSAFALHCGCQ